MNATRYTTQAACRAACRKGQYAAGHIDLVTRETYWMVFDGETVEQGAPVRSERHVYTPSGKKRTNREVCGRLFKRYAYDRAAFVAAAVQAGVKRATANAMFSHHTTGRYA